MKMKPSVARPLVGLATVLLVVAIVATALTIFSGGFTSTVPVTVVSPRAGLVMNTDAKVKMRGVEVGRVSSIESRPDGRAVLHLAMNPAQLHLIPADVLVDIASTTVFGAKFVQLIPPDKSSGKTMYAGQVLEGEHVTVEINTLFEQLTAVLAQIEPAKLNETLGALSRAISGRGKQVGQMFSDLNAFLAKLEPGLPALREDLSVAPDVFDVYADTAPDLLRIASNASQISQTVVDEQQNLDALLVSLIGLADIGNQFLSDNGPALTQLVRILLPTTALTDDYQQALTCSLNGLADLGVSGTPPIDADGVALSANFLWGAERYRYPGDMPKVAASGGPRCEVLPVGFEERPPYVVTDTGSNPHKYFRSGLLINTDALKQYLYGPLDGPPRNTSQIGQPG